MIITYFENIIQILIVLILAAAATIIVKRDISSLVKTYAAQSLLLALMAALLFVETGSISLLFLAIIIFVSKTVIIPTFMTHILKKLNIKRDVEFHFLSPMKSLFASVIIMIFVYISFSKLLSELNFFNSSLFFLGATIGISVVFMGMMVIFTRKQTITNVVGYLTMENGVVLFSLFLTELPLLVEVLIAVDLIMITLLATILAFGIDSTIEEFHNRLNPFQTSRKQTNEETSEDDDFLPVQSFLENKNKEDDE
jgi:hydrogenase-4 component E